MPCVFVVAAVLPSVAFTSAYIVNGQWWYHRMSECHWLPSWRRQDSWSLLLPCGHLFRYTAHSVSVALCLGCSSQLRSASFLPFEQGNTAAHWPHNADNLKDLQWPTCGRLSTWSKNSLLNNCNYNNLIADCANRSLAQFQPLFQALQCMSNHHSRGQQMSLLEETIKNGRQILMLNSK